MPTEQISIRTLDGECPAYVITPGGAGDEADLVVESWHEMENVEVNGRRGEGEKGSKAAQYTG